MSDLIERISCCIALFSWPRPTISKDCTSGTPEDIIVASWRLNTVMSLLVILPPPLPKSGFGFLRTFSGLTP